MNQKPWRRYAPAPAPAPEVPDEMYEVWVTVFVKGTSAANAKARACDLLDKGLEGQTVVRVRGYGVDGVWPYKS